MAIKQKIGNAMLIAPFIALAAWLIYSEGFLPTLVFFSLIGLFIGWIILATKWSVEGGD